MTTPSDVSTIQLDAPPKYRWLAIATIAVLVVLALNGYLVWTNLKDTERGVFGDMFGGMNALFSGLAFCGLIFTILQQQHAIKQQQAELQATRKEVENQVDQAKIQNDVLKQQSFEQSFYQLYRLCEEAGLRVTPTTQFKDPFEAVYERLRVRYEEEWNQHGTGMSPAEAVHTVLHEYPALARYFRYLVNVIKFVDDSEITKKRFYINLTQASMSIPAKSLLCYAVYFSGSNSFLSSKEVLAKYDFLGGDLILLRDRDRLFIRDGEYPPDFPI